MSDYIRILAIQEGVMLTDRGNETRGTRSMMPYECGWRIEAYLYVHKFTTNKNIKKIVDRWFSDNENYLDAKVVQKIADYRQGYSQGPVTRQGWMKTGRRVATPPSQVHAKIALYFNDPSGIDVVTGEVTLSATRYQSGFTRVV